MKGWKTWTGAALVAAGAVLEFLGYHELAQAVLTLGAAFGLVGVAHKVERLGGGK